MINDYIYGGGKMANKNSIEKHAVLGCISKQIKQQWRVQNFFVDGPQKLSSEWFYPLIILKFDLFISFSIFILND